MVERERPIQRFLEKGQDERPLGFDISKDFAVQVIDVVLNDGSRLGLPNSYLTLIKLEAGGRLTLTYPHICIAVEGRDLSPLYVALIAHMVRRMAASDAVVDSGTAATWIKTISIVEN